MYKHLLFFFMLLYARVGYGQNQSLKFEHLGKKEGLSQINVGSIIQDKRGFIWIGTRDGLNKYDGYNFTVYRSDANDTASISANFVWTLKEDKEGNIWIGTVSGGLNKYAWKKDK